MSVINLLIYKLKEKICFTFSYSALLIFSSFQLFDMVKQQRGESQILSQVEAIEGDVLLPGLGISEENLLKLREEVSIVYHCAATIR